MKQPEAARAALAEYANRVGGESSEPLEIQVTDLVADLLHLLTEDASEDGAISAVNSGIFHFSYEHEHGEHAI